MKRLIAVLSGLLVLPAFAEIAPQYYYEELMAQYADEMPDMEFVDTEIDVTDDTDTQETEPVTPVVPTAVSPRNANGRAAASRAIVSSNTSSGRNIAARNVTNATTARTVSTRPTTVTTKTNTTSRAATTNTGRSAVSRGATSRTQTARTTATNTVANRPTATVRSTGTQNTVSTTQPGLTTRTSSTRTTGANTTRASILQTDTVNSPLYISSRVGVSNTANVTSRVPTIRVGSSATGTAATTTSETTTSSTTSIDELAQLTDYCKAQYVACMDNFCNVLDDNQGRCSCSVNLKNYAETEAALKQATEDLQDVAMQIQYIGLTADEVETLFTQTEAELELQTSSDNSQLKNDLDKIKNMIIDVESGKATSTTSSGLSLDLSGLLDFTIDSAGFNLATLFGTNNNTDSISNQRGEQLYETAASRCKSAVLNSCAAQGVDITIITNSYDLEIDKACIAYERSLTDANDQMSSTVRNAKSVLQRARLLVAQQKNQYDLRGCVNALDTCMQDDFVCGDDYENCLDPTGKYIVAGEVVVGSKPGAPGEEASDIYGTWTYTDSESQTKKAWFDGTLSEYIETTVKDGAAAKTSVSMSEFLQNKIGYHDDDDGKNYGMCMSVLNRCQNITYQGSGQNAEYVPTNNVIKEFLNRTLVQIKSSQDTILANYAEECIMDVASCLAQNNYNVNNDSGTGNNIAIRACNPVITTCMSVNGVTGDLDGGTITAEDWIKDIMSN